MCVPSCDKDRFKSVLRRVIQRKKKAALATEMRKLAEACLDSDSTLAGRLALVAALLEKQADCREAIQAMFPSLSETERERVVSLLGVVATKVASELTTAGRKRIASKNFAIPSKAKTTKEKADSGNYPIHDIAHARNALARVAQHGSPEEIAKVRRAVYAKYPSLAKNKKKESKSD